MIPTTLLNTNSTNYVYDHIVYSYQTSTKKWWWIWRL